MPTLVVDRIPLPSLRFYTILSILWVSVCLYYSIKVTRDPDWKLHTNNTSIPVAAPPKIPESVPDSEKGEQILVDGVLESTVKIQEEPPDNPQLEDANQRDLLDIELEERIVNDTRSLGAHLRDVVTFMSQEPTCIWVSVLICCFNR